MESFLLLSFSFFARRFFFLWRGLDSRIISSSSKVGSQFNLPCYEWVERGNSNQSWNLMEGDLKGAVIQTCKELSPEPLTQHLPEQIYLLNHFHQKLLNFSIANLKLPYLLYAIFTNILFPKLKAWSKVIAIIITIIIMLIYDFWTLKKIVVHSLTVGRNPGVILFCKTASQLISAR